MVKYIQSIGRYFWKPLKICTKEGIKAIVFDEYFKVSAVAEFSGSEDSNQRGYFQRPSRRRESKEFGRIFKIACDELKEKSGVTHTEPGVMTLTQMTL